MPSYQSSLKSVASTAVVSMVLAGCGGSPDSSPASSGVDTPASQDARAAELAAKEQELAQREAALALKEKENELARREAELAAAQQASTPTAAKRAPANLVEPKPATKQPKPYAKPVEPAKPMVTRITVPSGTELKVALLSDLSTRTARSGDPFEARLASDVIVEGRLAAPSGSKVTGTVTDVVSGSNKIGGLPTLGLRFDQLQLDDGQRIAINGELVEQGKSDTGRDTAKILGGAAAGAILGHQVKKNDKGKVIGGLLGGAIGAVAAKKTGTEVELPSGTTLIIALGAPFEVNSR